MSFANQVQIGPEFFAKAKNDYNDYHWTIAREFMQNGIDCGSGRIDVTISYGDGSKQTRIKVRNNGEPMTQRILEDKLLALGASGKDFDNTVGGFGKAKEILYFCHDSYSIHSGSLQVAGSGAGYDISDAPFFHGTESIIMVDGMCVDEMVKAFTRFANECQWRGELFINRVQQDTNLKKGRRRRDLGWAVVYTNKSFQHRMIIRIDGMPMFHRWVSIDRCVIVEVDRSSKDVLTSNRDGLKGEYLSRLNSFIDELTVDKSSALRDVPTTTYHRFEGDKQEYGGVNAAAVQELITAAYATIPQPASASAEEETPVLAVDRHVDSDVGPSFVDKADHRRSGSCTFEFIIKNNTGMQVPDYFLPYNFSSYAKKLVSVWIKCMLEAHRLFGHEDRFSVGFILDEDREAEHEETDNYGRVYYINPAVVVEQSNSRSRSLKKRWKLNNAGRYAILAVVAHEFVHGLGFSPHDEGYAGKLTEVTGVMMANKRRFHHCFR